MKCQPQLIGKTDDGRYQHRCAVCGKVVVTRKEVANIKAMCGGVAAVHSAMLDDKEKAALFPDADPTLLGNRIAALTTAIGIPPCGGCNKRKAWINKAHAWVRALASGS